MSRLRAAFYRRLHNPTDNADEVLASLERTAASRDWHVVATFTDQPTRTAARLALDALLQAAARREFDVLMVRSLSHLAGTLPELIRVVNELRSHGSELLAADDGIDTTATATSSVFVTFAALGAFEHATLRERARTGLERARRTGTKIGRPSNLNDSVRAAVIALRARDLSIRRIAAQLRIGVSTVYRVLQAQA